MKVLKKICAFILLISVCLMLMLSSVYAASDAGLQENSHGDLSSIIINGLLIPLLPIVSGFIIMLIKKKISEMDQNKYVNLAEDAVCTAVAAVSQTYVDNLKKAQTFDQKAMKTAFEGAKNKALTIMGEQSKKVIKYLYGDLNNWLENKIEYYVKISK